MVDIVISGMGAWTAAGAGLGALESALREGRCCATPLSGPLPVPHAARVPVAVPELADFPDDRKAWLAFAALHDALADATACGEVLRRLRLERTPEGLRG